MNVLTQSASLVLLAEAGYGDFINDNGNLLNSNGDIEEALINSDMAGGFHAKLVVTQI